MPLYRIAAVATRMRTLLDIGVTFLLPRQQLGWEGFTAAYRAELDRWPRLAHLAVIRQIALWLQTFETVTLLSFEPSMPRGAALTAWQERGEFVPYAQRHILRDWLLTGPAAAEATAP